MSYAMAKRARATASPGYTEPNRGSAEHRETASSMQRAEGVRQRHPEAVQCLRGLMQRVLGLMQVSRRLTQRPEGPTLSFSCVGEGFMGQVF